MGVRKRKRVPRTRAGGTYTEAEFMQKIRSKLRELSRYWPSKKIVMYENRVQVKGKRHKYEYTCQSCDTSGLPATDVEIDHIVPAGSLRKLSDLPGFVERLLCEPEGLQVLCKPCHKDKTARERKERNR